MIDTKAVIEKLREVANSLESGKTYLNESNVEFDYSSRVKYSVELHGEMTCKFTLTQSRKPTDKDKIKELEVQLEWLKHVLKELSK